MNKSGSIEFLLILYYLKFDEIILENDGISRSTSVLCLKLCFLADCAGKTN